MCDPFSFADKEISVRVQARDAQAFTSTKGDPWHDDVYFDSYAWMHIHWEMLSDYKRCSAYYDAIMRFKEDIQVRLLWSGVSVSHFLGKSDPRCWMWNWNFVSLLRSCWSQENLRH